MYPNLFSPLAGVPLSPGVLFADAAHELRSPLTALSLRAGRLADAPMSSPARERLDVLRQGIERARNLLEQLLSMARAQLPAASRVTAS